MQNELFQQAKQAAQELVAAANLKKGDILVVGCSSSEVAGGVIGHNSSLETAEAVFGGIYEVLQEKGIYLAAQCCEHLNRAICVERAAVPNAEEVCVVPQPKAGGIGMHLKRVAVPVRLSLDHIGSAILLAARTRPKYIGGERAKYA